MYNIVENRHFVDLSSACEYAFVAILLCNFVNLIVNNVLCQVFETNFRPLLYNVPVDSL